MRIRRHILVLAVCLFTATGSLLAQQKEIDKADKALERLSYVDARKILLKVAEEGHASAELYQKIGDTYYYNADYDNAKVWYEKLSDEFSGEMQPETYFRYSQTLRALELYDKADTAMNEFNKLQGYDIRAELFEENPDYVEEASRVKIYKYKLEEIRSINSRYSDWAPTIYEGKLIFASSRDTGGAKKIIHKWTNQPFLDLYESKLSDSVDTFGKVQKFSKVLNTKFHESTTTFTKDGKTAYFTRNNYTKGRYGTSKNGTNKLKIYKSTKKGNTWSVAEELPFNNDQHNTAHPALSPDGTKLYFASDRKGTLGKSDIWVVDILEDNQYSEPRNLGRPINTEGRESFPYISENNKLYFASNGHPGLGGLDVYTTMPEKGEGVWMEPINLGEPINSSYDDFTFIVADSLNAGFFASNRKQGVGGDDIYRFTREELAPPPCDITIAGIVTDSKTGARIPMATVQLLDMNNNVLREVIAGADASFAFDEPACDRSYTVRGSKEDYSTDEKVVNTPSEGANLELSLELGLEKVVLPFKEGDDLTKILNLNPIYFDFDRYNIRPDAALELAKVIAVMKEYPTMVIDARSHTDSRGQDRYNLILSDKRAKASVAYIIEQGIPASRISGKGYGETQLVNGCDKGNDSDCTEEEHQLNRRTEFIIIKM